VFSVVLLFTIETTGNVEKIEDENYTVRKTRRATVFLSYVLVFFVALSYRAFHLIYWSRTPYFRTPALDELYHHYWAKYIAAGNLLFPGVFFRAPFYPYLLGLFYTVLGDSPWPVRIAQVVIGAFGCVLVGLLAKECFDDWRAGLLAGIITALSPMPVLFESRLLLDWLLVPLGAVMLFFLLRMLREEGYFAAFLAGLFGGLFAITRPNILAVFPFLLLWAILEQRKKPVLKKAVLLVIGFLLPILPVAVHNISRGEFSLIATQGGLNLYLGNNPEADGMTPTLPGYGGNWTIRDAWRTAELEVGHSLSPVELDRYYLDKALHFAQGNPGQQLELIARKTALLFSPVEHGNNGSPEFFKRFSPALLSPLGWGTLLVLAFFGISFIWRERGTRLLLLWFLLYSGTIVLFFVNARFRLPLLVALIPLGTGGLMRAFDALKNKKFKVFLWAAPMGAVALAIVLISPARELNARGMAESWFGLGNIYLREKKLARADSAYAKAIEYLPTVERVNLNRGVIAYRRGDWQEALKFFYEEVEIGGDVSAALSNIGLIARLHSDKALALNAGKGALDADPSDIEARINYSRSLLEAGLVDSALSVAAAGLATDSLDKRLLLVAGTAASSIGDTGKAKSFFSIAARPSPSDVLRLYELSGVYSVEAAGAVADSVLRGYALYNLASIETYRGNYKQAIEHLQKSVQLAPAFPDAWGALGTVLEREGQPEPALAAFEKALKIGGESPELLYNIGLVQAQLGRFSEAEESFERALELRPDFAPAQEKLMLLEKLSKTGTID